jgi:hypothetical protein
MVVRRKRFGPAEDGLVYDSPSSVDSIVGVAYYRSLHSFPTAHSFSHSVTMAQEFVVVPKSPPDLNIPDGNVTVKVSCIDR